MYFHTFECNERACRSCRTSFNKRRMILYKPYLHPSVVLPDLGQNKEGISPLLQ